MLTQDEKAIGKMHNIILKDLNDTVKFIPKEYGKRFAQSKKMQLNKINTEQVQCAISLQDVLYSSEYKNKLIETINNEKNRISEGNFNKSDYIIGLFEDIFNKYVETNDDILFIINKYQEIIDNSNELTAAEKEYVSYALSTAIYSFNYWNSKEKVSLNH